MRKCLEKTGTLAQVCGLDARFFVLGLYTVIATSVVYAAWLVGVDRPLDDALLRFLTGTFWMLGAAVMASPLFVPCMVTGWSLGWVFGDLSRLPVLVRATVAAFGMGSFAVLPILLTFGRTTGWSAQNDWNNVVYPMLLIIPTSAILIAPWIYRKS